MLPACITGIACLAFGFWVLENEMRRRRVKGFPMVADVDTPVEDIDVDTPVEDAHHKHGIDVDTPVEDAHHKHGIDVDTHIDVDIHLEERKDRISKLPDDVISLIVSRLHTIDVVRMSILSRRWKHVYTFVSEVRFSCLRMCPLSLCYKFEGEKLSELKRKFVQSVDSFLEHHSGSRITSFELVCCFRGCILDSFRRWMDSICRLGVDRLIVRYCSSPNCVERNPPVFSSDFLPGPSAVKHIYLVGGSFQILSQTALEDIDLTGVAFTSEAVECILLNCCNLQSLKFKFCVLPSKLHIHGPDLQLKTLTVLYCSEVAEIDLSAINLTTFELYTFRMTTLTFSNVPLLQTMFVTKVAPCVFEKAAKDLPNLKFMHFWTDARLFEAFEIGGVNKLRHLRQLALFLDQQNELDLLALATILDVCPLLHKLQVSMGQLSTFNGKGAEKRVVRHHTKLKEVEFSGFSGTENEYNFILCVLANGVSLERLSIFLEVRQYHVNVGRWQRLIGNQGYFKLTLRSIREWLQGKAISKNVEILIV
ncbi:putative F-box protein At1g67390 [Henckelia pumila]|uniref:putative F-box protein At1g67390 n=1 Tax=Henckelia pumila TaxID=405737 RepID=UPI003C6DF1C6